MAVRRRRERRCGGRGEVCHNLWLRQCVLVKRAVTNARGCILVVVARSIDFLLCESPTVAKQLRTFIHVCHVRLGQSGREWVWVFTGRMGYGCVVVAPNHTGSHSLLFIQTPSSLPAPPHVHHTTSVRTTLTTHKHGTELPTTRPINHPLASRHHARVPDQKFAKESESCLQCLP
jgi:hypothetical protein